MRILTQNQSGFVALDHFVEVYTRIQPDIGCAVYAGSAISSDGVWMLGMYPTEERAREVLLSIFHTPAIQKQFIMPSE